jgi:hypothetical protein
MCCQSQNRLACISKKCHPFIQNVINTAGPRSCGFFLTMAFNIQAGAVRQFIGIKRCGFGLRFGQFIP